MRTTRGVVLAGLVAAVLLVAVSPFASSSPDGLEKVAEDEGFAGQASAGHAALSYGRLTGVVGLLVTFVLVVVVVQLLRRARTPS